MYTRGESRIRTIWLYLQNTHKSQQQKYLTCDDGVTDDTLLVYFSEASIFNTWTFRTLFATDSTAPITFPCLGTLSFYVTLFRFAFVMLLVRTWIKGVSVWPGERSEIERTDIIEFHRYSCVYANLVEPEECNACCVWARVNTMRQKSAKPRWRQFVRASSTSSVIIPRTRYGKI